MPPAEPRRSAWSSGMWDDWDPEKDPGLRRMAESMRLRPPETAPERPEPIEVAPAPEPTAQTFSRSEKVALLVQRVRAGDLSAISSLRELLGE